MERNIKPGFPSENVCNISRLFVALFQKLPWLDAIFLLIPLSLE